MKFNYYRKGEDLPLDSHELTEQVRRVFGTILLNSFPCMITLAVLPAAEQDILIQLLIITFILLFSFGLTYFSKNQPNKSRYNLLTFYPVWLIITVSSIVLALLIGNKLVPEYFVFALAGFWLIPYLCGIYNEFKNITIKMEK